MAASAQFEIDPGTGTFGPPGVAQNAANTGVTVNLRIASTSGIDPTQIAWRIFGTHGATAPTISLSGAPLGQLASFTIEAGSAQAFGIELKVNGGEGKTGEAATTSKSAVYVLDDLGNRPFFIGETFESDDTFGTVPRLNDALSGGGGLAAIVDVTQTPFLADNTGVASAVTAIQAALDFVMDPTTAATGIYLPGGTYLIDDTLNLHVFSGGTFLQRGFTMEGPTPGFVGDTTKATLNFTALDKPCLAIQNTRGIKIKNLNIQGLNTWYSDAGIGSNFELILTATYIVNGTRQNDQSPHCAIAIDPYAAGVAAPDQYPGQSAKYVGALASSRLYFENVSIDGFVLGVGASMTGLTANAENVTFEDCQISQTRLCMNLGSSQNRSWVLRNCNFAQTEWGISNRMYPEGGVAGDIPTIYGGTFGQTKWLFNLNIQSNTFECSGLKVESTLSAGWIGSSFSSANLAASFSAVNWSFFDLYDASTQTSNIDMHLATYGAVEFEGSSIRVGTGAPILFFNHDLLRFSSCDFHVDDSNDELQFGFHDWDQVTFENCKTNDSTLSAGIAEITEIYTGDDLSDFNRFPIPPGARIVGTDGNTYENRAIRETNITSVTLTDAAAQGEATFTAVVDPDAIKVGDLISTNSTKFKPESVPPNTTQSYQGPIGRVKSVILSTVTLEHVPSFVKSKLPDVAPLFVKRIPRSHELTTGDVSAGVATVSNVVVPGGDAQTVWRTGDRIFGVGIADSTRIASVTATTIVLQQNATGTATGTPLFDAQLSRTVSEDESGNVAMAGADIIAAGNIEIDGDLNHDGLRVGFYSASPATQASDILFLTDNIGGTDNDTLDAIPDPMDGPLNADTLRDDLVANTLPEIRDALTTMSVKLNELRTIIRNLGFMA